MPEPDSKVVQVIRAHRENMNAAEEATVRLMAERWLGVERALDANIAALANEMLLKAQNGEVITDAMVRRAERYEILKAQATNEIAKYNKEAVQIISAGQTNALQLGIDTAQDAIHVSYPSAFSTSFNRINIGAVNSMIGFAGDGSPLNDLLKEDFPDAVDGLLQALIDGVAQGKGADAVSRMMAEGAGMGLDRSLLIARTELNRAYRTGSTEQYRESGVTLGFMRLVARDEACLACIILDGEKFDSEDEMDDHPNGRCTCVPIIEGMPEPVWEKAQDWFANQSEEIQRELMGDTRFELYQAGVPLEAFASKKQDDVWGASPQIVNIGDLPTAGEGETTPNDSSPMADFEARIVRQTYETAGVYDANGNLLFEKDGTKRHVKFTDEEIAKMAGNVVTHNHPSGSSFSADDIAMLIYSNAKEIRAVGKNFTYSMVSNGESGLKWKQVKSTYNRILKTQIVAMTDDMNLNPYNSTWEIFAQKHNMTYERIPR